jgi:hypothetical protein
VSQAGIRETFYRVARVLSRLLGSRATWSEVEFEELASSYAQLAHTHPRLLELVTALRPLATLDRVLEKLERGRRRGAERAEAA